MHFKICKLLVLFLIFVFVKESQAQGVNLGRLHWCGPLCLCDDNTLDEMHCFSDREIYSLIDLDERKVQRLGRAKFKLTEKLMWCTETCLCHKEGKKEFKCTDRVVLGEFINAKAPHLSSYLEPEVEVFDMRDIVSKADDVVDVVPEESEAHEEGEEHDIKDHHEKKKNRKHKKNKKKHHHEHRESTEEVEDFAATQAASSTEETITKPAGVVLSANVFPQASTGHVMPSKSTDAETQTPVLEVPRGSKTVAEEMTEDFSDLKQAIEEIKLDVALNQHILLVTVAVAALAMIGVTLLSVYLCCVRRPRKGQGKGQRSNGSHQQDDNNVAKANLEEAW